MKELYQAHMMMILYRKDCEYRWTDKSMELNGLTMRHMKRTIQLCLEFYKKAFLSRSDKFDTSLFPILLSLLAFAYEHFSK